MTPPALIAATPVGATTIIRLGETSLSLFKMVVLPSSGFSCQKEVGSGVLQQVEGEVKLLVCLHGDL